VKKNGKDKDKGYDQDDVQMYYDLLLVGGDTSKEALKRTNKKFERKDIKVSPVGNVTVPDMDKPAQPTSILQAQMGAQAAGAMPPEEPPPEEAPPEPVEPPETAPKPKAPPPTVPAPKAPVPKPKAPAPKE